MPRILPVPEQPRARLPVLLPAAVLAAALVAGGCGLKGDLYLPEPQAESPAATGGDPPDDSPDDDGDDDEANA